MPITITITDPTPEQIAALFGAPGVAPSLQPTAEAVTAAPKATRKKPDAGLKGDDPITPERVMGEVSAEDAELAREIAADVAEAPPEPKGATAVVDAGTGKPIEQAPSEPVELTMDMVRANATRLAQADAPKLKAILGEFGAAKLSEVKPDDLPDFAGRVLAALG